MGTRVTTRYPVLGQDPGSQEFLLPIAVHSTLLLWLCTWCNFTMHITSLM